MFYPCPYFSSGQDFVATAVFTLLFFIASCAWAAGVSTVKFWTNLDNLTQEGGILSSCNQNGNVCKSTQTASYGALNISVVSVSLWF